LPNSTVLHAHEVEPRHGHPAHSGDLSVDVSQSSRSTSSYARTFKPLFDKVAGALLLVLISPLLLVVAGLVLVTLGRPVFYSQQRVGKSGRNFRVLKFRTMKPDRRSQSQPISLDCRRGYHKSVHDPRHTRLGRLIRKYSLDELPQIVNVVRGQMSLVGPRPELPAIVDGYEPWQHKRHLVRPGITGLWQINARGEGEMNAHTHLDIQYVEQLSPLLDAMILLKTVPSALIRRTGT
jgi:lipopolysaccharide/colanic/teichoic acid biosynthesis glycosyltransferase